MVGQDGAEHLGLANAPRNHLRVLRSEIENDNLLLHAEKAARLPVRGVIARKKFSHDPPAAVTDFFAAAIDLPARRV